MVEGFCSLLPYGLVVTASREIAKLNDKHNHGFGNFYLQNFFFWHHTNQYTLHYARTAHVGSVAVAHDHPRIDPRDLFVPPSLSERKEHDVHRGKCFFISCRT